MNVKQGQKYKAEEKKSLAKAWHILQKWKIYNSKKHCQTNKQVRKTILVVSFMDTISKHVSIPLKTHSMLPKKSIKAASQLTLLHRE